MSERVDYAKIDRLERQLGIAERSGGGRYSEALADALATSPEDIGRPTVPEDRLYDSM